MKARSALEWGDGAAGPVLRLVRDEAVPPCAASGADFFPGTLADAGPAQAVCATCPLRAPCLAAALERHEPWGVWGGVLFEGGLPWAPRGPRGGARRRPPRSVGLYCPNNHRRGVANTRTGDDGRVTCLDCERARSARARARKGAGPRRTYPGAVSLWCVHGHRRSVSNTRTFPCGQFACLDCARDREDRAAGQSGLELVA